MKKIITVLSLVLALNFLVLAGAIGWLFQSGRLNREKVAEIKKLLAVASPTTQPTTQPADENSNKQPLLKLDELLKSKAGHPAAEQVEFIRLTFDEKMAQLERRQRELQDQQRQVELASDQLARDRTALEEQRKQLAASADQSTQLQADKGFQDSLQLYISMPPKQVKKIFMSLDDAVVLRYLQNMPQRNASSIIKEYKLPQEVERIQRVLEMMRTAQASTRTAKE